MHASSPQPKSDDQPSSGGSCAAFASEEGQYAFGLPLITLHAGKEQTSGSRYFYGREASTDTFIAGDTPAIC